MRPQLFIDNVWDFIEVPEDEKWQPSGLGIWVSNHGRCFSCNTKELMATTHASPTYGPYLRVHRGGKPSRVKVAEMVLYAFREDYMAGAPYGFADGNHLNCHLDNLTYIPASLRCESHAYYYKSKEEICKRHKVPMSVLDKMLNGDRAVIGQRRRRGQPIFYWERSDGLG